MSEPVLMSVAELAEAIAPAGGQAMGSSANAPVVLDARWNLTGRDGRAEFEDGHVPGARFVEMHGALAGEPGAGGRHPLPAIEQFQAAMRAAGVGDGPVVVMDGGAPLAAARLWWLLTDAGHAHVRVLDGGFAAWRAAGGAVAVGPSVAVAQGSWVARPGRRRVVGVETVEALVAAGPDAVGSDGRRLVDVRSAARFRGEHEPIDPVAGHIPGAINVESTASFRDGLFRPAAELAAHFDAAGVGDDAIVYCGSGITACQTLLAMSVAGRGPAALFAGSWSAWVAGGDRPIATGQQPG